MSPNILLLTYSEDFYTIDLVWEALSDLGTSPIRINTDEYPEKMPIDISFGQNVQDIKWHFKDRAIWNHDIAGVWNRRIWSPKINPEIDPTYRKICIRESQSIFKFMLPLLNAAWMDPQDIVERASNKLLQLKKADEAGLQIPNTLVSNFYNSARNFFYEQNKQVITKMAMPTAYSMNHSSMAMRTHQVGEEDLDDLDSLVHCPMIFQREIKKQIELRVVYVDGDFFTGGIDASQTINGQTDWRLSQSGEVAWESYELPDDLKQKITTLMKSLELTFGALDIIKTSEGKYIFLEVNPVGEWGMLQKDLGHPIAETIAKSLYKRIK